MFLYKSKNCSKKIERYMNKIKYQEMKNPKKKLSGSKCPIMASNGLKWLQMAPNDSKEHLIALNETKLATKSSKHV